MKEKILCLRKNVFFEVFLLIVLNEPGYVAQCLPMADQIWDLLKIVCAVYIILCVAGKRPVSSFVLFLFLFIGGLLLSTALNGGSLHEWLIQNVYMLLLCLYFNVRLEEDALAAIKSLYLVLGSYALINFLSFCLFPGGMYADRFHSRDCWFLGRDNSSALILLSAMYISYFYIVYVKKKVTSLALISICSAYGFMMLVWSGTSVIAMTLWLVCLLILKNGRWNRMFTMKRCFAAGVGIHIFLVCLKGYHLFGFLVDGILKKSGSLWVRVELWNRVIALICEKPFLGHGIEETNVKTAKLGFEWAGSAHNYFLNVGYQGGLLALALVFVMMGVAAYRFDKLSEDRRSRVIPMTFLVILLMFTMEAYQGSVWPWVLLVLACNIDKIEGAEVMR